MKLNVKVALLTNVVPTYRVPLLLSFQEHVQHLRTFVGLKEVPDRDWHLFHGGLDIILSRTIQRIVRFQNVHGFQDESHVQVPYDTIWVLARYRPDVILSSEFGMRTLFACAYKILFPKVKLILWATLSERTEETRGVKKQALRKLILKRIDGIFVNGHSGERYVRALGFANKPLGYINQTIDNDFFLGPITRPVNGPIKLFFVGQIIERKGLYPFLTQLAKWCGRHPEKQVSVTIAGNGAEETRLKTIVAPPNLTLAFPGIAQSAQLPAYYHSADISIFPTLADEWGVVVNEAMVAGLPVLASKHSQAVEELITDNVNGWIFDPNDREDMYNAIDRALTTDCIALDGMRQQAIDAIRGLTPDVVADRMVSVLHQVCGDGVVEPSTH